MPDEKYPGFFRFNSSFTQLSDMTNHFSTENMRMKGERERSVYEREEIVDKREREREGGKCV